jgi:hypothetical protein
MSENATVVQILAGVVGGLAVAILAINAAIKISAIVTAAWNAVMAANPVMLVVIAVIALIAGIVLLWNKCEGFRNAVLAIWEAIKTGAEAAWNAIKAVVSAVATGIANFIKGAGDVIGSVWNAIKSAAETVWNAIKSVVDGVVNAIKGFIDGAATTIKSIWDSIKTAAETAWNGIKSTVDSVVSGIKGFIDGLLATVTGVWDDIQSAGEALWGPIGDAASAVFDTILGIIDDVSGAIGDVVGAIQGALDWVGNLWDKIVNTPAPPVVPGGVSATGFAAASTSPSLGKRGLLNTPASRSASSASAAGSTIIIQGALDPDAVGRQVQAVLRRRERRAGITVAGFAGIAPA